MIGPDYDLAGYVPMRYMVEKMGQKGGKFGILYQDDDFGKALLAGYQKAMKEFGLASVAEIPFKRGAKDFSAEVLTLKDKGVTGVYLGTLTTESASVMSEFRRLDMKVTIGTLWAGQLPVAVKLASPSGFQYLIPDYYASNYDPAGQQTDGTGQEAPERRRLCQLQPLHGQRLCRHQGAGRRHQALRRHCHPGVRGRPAEQAAETTAPTA